MKKLFITMILTACVLLSTAIPLFSQTNALQLNGPRLSSFGLDTAGIESPYDDTVNPAASAGTQRPTLDFSYFAIPGLDTEKGLANRINAGISIPSNLGVFSASGHFATSNFSAATVPDLAWGTYGALNVSFAKDLLDNLYFGVGLGFQVGDKDWGLGLDLGFINFVADTGFIKDFAWGVSLLGLGKGMYTTSDNGHNPGLYPALPPNFTPTIGTQFKLIKTPDFSWGVNTNLEFPSFQNLLLTAGFDFSILRVFSIQASYNLDVQQTIATSSANRPFPFSFGFGINIGGISAPATSNEPSSEASLKNNEFNPSFSFTPMGYGIYAFGGGLNVPIGVIDKTPPVIKLGDPIFDDDTGSTAPAAPPASTSPSDSKQSSLPMTHTVSAHFSSQPELASGSGAAESPSTASGQGGNVTQGSGSIAYISPNLDGIHDTLTLPLNLSDERFITSYTLTIRNDSGLVVRTIKNKETRPETANIDNLLESFVRVKSGLRVPPTIVWDGRADDGTVVPDGSYSYQLEVSDDNNNTSKTVERPVVVDTKKPELKIEAPQLAFAPGGDRPVLQINQVSGASLSPVDSWTASILDASGKPVHTWTYKDTLPPQTLWDGKTNDGILAPDGLYTFRLSTSNRAGNRASSEISNIQLINQQTPIVLSIDTAWFSPNGDGIKDTVNVVISASDKVKVESWNAQLVNSKGQTVRNYKGVDAIPQTLVVDGNDDNGKVLPEDSYKLNFEALYINGNRPKGQTPPMNLKLTKPSITVTTDYTVFSPNSDKNTLPFHQVASTEPLWEGQIRSSDVKNPQVVRSWKWRGQPDATLVWDGKDDQNNILPDGYYTYQVTATDLAGNTGLSAPIVVRVDNRPTDISIRANRTSFSPGTSSPNKTIGFDLSQTISEGIASWTIRILAAPSSSGTVVYTLSGKGLPSGSPTWDGKKSSGGTAEDGSYVAEYSLVYDKGNKPVAFSSPFTINTKPPQISLSADYLVFSPDGDNHKDALTIKQASSVLDQWKGEIINTAGKTVRTYYWQNSAQNFSWDGRDENGNIQPDGAYSYVASGTDKAGNTGRQELKGIVIDTRPTPLLLLTDTKGFAPGTGRPDVATISFRPLLSIMDGVVGWKLKLVNTSNANRLERTLSGSALPPASIVWDGTDENKKIASDGKYEAVLSVEYAKGNQPETRSQDFILNVSGPKAQLAIAPNPFSPDDDGVDDEVGIGIAVDDLSPISKWGLEIFDPQGTSFVSFSGQGAPTSRVVWNGRSSSGELVQAALDYNAVLTVTDSLGNISTTKGVISVDVLVIRDGDLLRIRIPGINFPPNSPDLASPVLDADRLAQNVKTLNRLAQVLRKYGSYQITVEGHANTTQYQSQAAADRENREELQPLSEKRAKAVRDALIDRGIAASRLSTVGMGGTRPVVPNDDKVNNWKNRRVEFILRK